MIGIKFVRCWLLTPRGALAYFCVWCCVVGALAVLMSGCAGRMPASVSGECRVFDDPGFAVRGKTLRDSRWIGSTQEKGIVTCGWIRPRGR